MHRSGYTLAIPSEDTIIRRAGPSSLRSALMAHTFPTSSLARIVLQWLGLQKLTEVTTAEVQARFCDLLKAKLSRGQFQPTKSLLPT